MSKFLTQVPTTATFRIVDRVAAGVCLLTVALLPVAHGALAFGLTSFYVALQSGILHTGRVLGYEFPTSIRYATTGLGLGVCLSVHAFVRVLNEGIYLEYVGGRSILTTLDGVVVGLAHVVVPLAAVLHSWGVPPTDPVPPMLLAATEVSAVALLHEAVVLAEDRTLEGPRLLGVWASCVVSVMAWVFLMETLNRLLAPSRD